MIATLGRLARPLRAGIDKTAFRDPRLSASQSITVTSQAFTDGAPIPLRYCSFDGGENLSPAVAWHDIPTGTAELVLVIEDADPPLPRPIVHALASNIDPASDGLAEGVLNVRAVDWRPRRQPCNGIAAFGKRGYLGPKPIPGHGPHRYVFQLFALDTPCGLGIWANRANAIKAMEGHVLAVGVLTGISERR